MESMVMQQKTNDMCDLVNILDLVLSILESKIIHDKDPNFVCAICNVYGEMLKDKKYSKCVEEVAKNNNVFKLIYYAIEYLDSIYNEYCLDMSLRKNASVLKNILIKYYAISILKGYISIEELEQNLKCFSNYYKLYDDLAYISKLCYLFRETENINRRKVLLWSVEDALKCIIEKINEN